MSDETQRGSMPGGPRRFATTHWSVVLAAGSSSSPDYQEAISTLCRTYWFPLYAYLRRRGYDSNQAEDYTQAFFARMLERHDLRVADPKRGKFRSFLLAALKHFLADERDHARAKKRGGGREVLSLDFTDAESRYALEPADELSPEKVFEQSWALTVLARTMARLAAESAAAKKQKLFQRLKVYLTMERRSVPYRNVARELNMSESAVKVAVHRLKKRYRELLRDEIAQTVVAEDEIEDEIRALFAALAR